MAVKIYKSDGQTVVDDGINVIISNFQYIEYGETITIIDNESYNNVWNDFWYRLQKEDGSPCGATKAEVLDYLATTTECGGVAPATSIGDLLIKTGQTTSYRTGDDGDIEAGRLSSFDRLKANNPFENDLRFTDENGEQTYGNDIVIDWSTYDGSAVLGYYKGDISTSRLWNDAIDWGVALSVGTFTSGWRLANVREIINIANFSISPCLNYAPFSTSSDFYTSTTWNILSDRALFLDNSHAYCGIGFKPSASYYTMATRNFTVSGRTLS
jgi:hypothetical protein